MEIKVIGLGAGDINQLPLGIYNELLQAETDVYVRTLDHPVIEALQKEGVVFQSFDHIYEKHDQFHDVYEEIAEILTNKAAVENVIYAVPGHPLMAEQTVQLLLQAENVDVNIRGGQSFLDAMFASLKIDPIDGFQLIDATSFAREQLNYENHIIFAQVYDAFVASEVKLELLEDLPADHPVTIIEAAGSEHEEKIKVPLEELDRVTSLSNLTSVYVAPIEKEKLTHSFNYLRDIIRILRSEKGCPWDRKQTHESLRKYAIEEVYELVDAINREDDEAIEEELGDVLLQVMLHSQIGEEVGYFSIEDVIRTLNEKIIRRHPHVFADEKADNEAEVEEIWQKVKQEEGKRKEDILKINKALPQLEQAVDIQKAAAKLGFDWDDVSGVWDKFSEELQEVKDAIENGNKQDIEEEFGDLLFVLANLAKWYKVNPELALQTANEKFMRRFKEVAEEAEAKGEDIQNLSFDQFNLYWKIVKERE